MRTGTQVLPHTGTRTQLQRGRRRPWEQTAGVFDCLTNREMYLCTCSLHVVSSIHLYTGYTSIYRVYTSIYRTFKVLIQFLHFKNRDRNKRNSLEPGNFWNFRNMENCLLWWLKSECVTDIPSKNNILTIWVYPVIMFSTLTKTIIRFKLRFLDF